MALTTAEKQRLAAIEQKIADHEARLIKLEQPVLPNLNPLPPKPTFFATFNRNPFRTATGDGMSDDGVWWVEQKIGTNRAVIAPIGREGGTGLLLHTEPGDSYVSGSNANERNDVALRGPQELKQGDEGWWAHSVLFPDAYAVPPPGGWATVFDFHDLPAPTDTRQGGQANFHIFITSIGELTLRGHGGPEIVYDSVGNQYSFGALIDKLVRNVWYDFVYHIRWSSSGDGFFDAWLNGKRKLQHKGPTLYTGCGAYLKLANYHSAFGRASSVIHDRIVRGPTANSVSLTPLE